MFFSALLTLTALAQVPCFLLPRGVVLAVVAVGFEGVAFVNAVGLRVAVRPRFLVSVDAGLSPYKA